MLNVTENKYNRNNVKKKIRQTLNVEKVTVFDRSLKWVCCHFKFKTMNQRIQKNHYKKFPAALGIVFVVF